MIRVLRRTGRFVLAASLATVALGAAALPPGTDDEIYERIKPIGTLNLPESTAASEDVETPVETMEADGDEGTASSEGAASSEGMASNGAEAASGAAEVASADAGDGRSGEQIFDTYCTTCHAPAMAGAIGAPAYGSAEAWEPRIAKGMEALYESTYNGLNAMPARGLCTDCSDAELRRTVDYMVDAAES